MSDITREDLATWKLRATLPSQANNWVMTGPDALRLIALVEELQAEVSARRIAHDRANGALADAGTVQTDDIERGIRQLTAERDRLAEMSDNLPKTLADVRCTHPWARRGARVVYRVASGVYSGTLTGRVAGTNWFHEPILRLRLDDGSVVGLSVMVLTPEASDD